MTQPPPAMENEKLRSVLANLNEARTYASIKSGGTSLTSVMPHLIQSCLEVKAEGLELPVEQIREGLEDICLHAITSLGVAIAFLEYATNPEFGIAKDYTPKVEAAVPMLASQKLREVRRSAKRFRTPASRILDDIKIIDEATKWGFEWHKDAKEAILRKAYEKGVLLIVDKLIPQTQQGSSRYNCLYNRALANSRTLQMPTPT